MNCPVGQDRSYVNLFSCRALYMFSAIIKNGARKPIMSFKGTFANLSGERKDESDKQPSLEFSEFTENPTGYYKGLYGIIKGKNKDPNFGSITRNKLK